MRAIRSKTRLSQEAFASVLGFTVHQIRQWEYSANTYARERSQPMIQPMRLENLSFRA